MIELDEGANQYDSIFEQSTSTPHTHFTLFQLQRHCSRRVNISKVKMEFYGFVISQYYCDFIRDISEFTLHWSMLVYTVSIMSADMAENITVSL